jgi:hypothetical protein
MPVMLPHLPGTGTLPLPGLARRAGQLALAAGFSRRLLPQMWQRAARPVSSMVMKVVQPLVLQRSWRDPAARRMRRWAWARWLRLAGLLGERDNILCLSGEPHAFTHA